MEWETVIQVIVIMAAAELMVECAIYAWRRIK